MHTVWIHADRACEAHQASSRGPVKETGIRAIPHACSAEGVTLRKRMKKQEARRHFPLCRGEKDAGLQSKQSLACNLHIQHSKHSEGGFV